MATATCATPTSTKTACDMIYDCLDQNTVLKRDLPDNDPDEFAARGRCRLAELSNDDFVDMFALVVILKARFGDPLGPLARAPGNTQ